ncbi:MAG: PTS sugar transporter subunit IIB [Thermodesulfobacteriota bacterium]|nr:PTS sugar transporter subunit IIB [Thermodesulfobacteriota bacterium]
MAIVLARVDDRFIHGQILEAWIPYLNAQALIVANDRLANDSFQKTIMSLALPERIALEIVSLDEACSIYRQTGFKDKKTLLICSTIEDAWRLYSMGLVFDKLNIGNMRARDDSRQISYSVWMDARDEGLLKELMGLGVRVMLRSVPKERGMDMSGLIDMVNV